ncbi:MAG TPA: hypothetical protein VMH28_07055 [Candidatus Acidoferrales bacterium]|nr:hypothetical protein [Candidatus Acidoferrales bacterium]
MRIALGVLGLLAILAVRSLIQNQYENVMAGVATGDASKCLAMAGNTTSEEDGRTYIVGSVRNTCTREIRQVTIAFKLDRQRDAKADLPGAPVFAYVNDVKAGETRRFKTAFPVGKDAIYRFDGFNAF